MNDEKIRYMLKYSVFLHEEDTFAPQPKVRLTVRKLVGWFMVLLLAAALLAPPTFMG